MGTVPQACPVLSCALGQSLVLVARIPSPQEEGGVNHPGHHAGARATRVNHNGARVTRDAHATRDRQGARRAHARPMEWWSAGCGRPVQRAEAWGTWASRTRKRGEAGGGRPLSGGVWAAKIVKQPPAATSTTPGTPTTGHHYRTNGTCRDQHSPSTPPTGLRERGTNTSRSTGRSAGQNAATRRNMRREERVTVQGPGKKQRLDGMSHQGGVHACISLKHWVPSAAKVGVGQECVCRKSCIFFFVATVCTKKHCRAV